MESRATRALTSHALVLACLALPALSGAAVRDDILALTGNRRTKIVWSREVGAVNHAYGVGGVFRLMRFDTDVGTEADVLGSTGSYFRAKITWDGARIVYNRGVDLHVVPFGSGVSRLVCPGAVLGCLWFDNATGKEYAFVARGGILTSDNVVAPLHRINIEDTTDRVVIWESRSFAPIWLSVSRDGKKLGGHFPWSAGGGIYDIVSGSLLNFGQYG